MKFLKGILKTMIAINIANYTTDAESLYSNRFMLTINDLNLFLLCFLQCYQLYT